MSYLDKINRFVKNPVNLDIKRSRFTRPSENKFTMNSGVLVPVYCDEVLPGDTFDLSFSALIRSITPAVPVMDNAFLDVYFFWVPNRISALHAKDWEKIFGENTTGYWAPTTESTLRSTGNTFTLGKNTTAAIVHAIEPQSPMNYLGLPICTNDDFGSGFTYSLSLLPINAYIKIWNEWFRDQNLQAPKTLATASNVQSMNVASGLLPVAKVHDYFTSALPSPQKGDSVLLPIADGLVPVNAGAVHEFDDTALDMQDVDGNALSDSALGVKNGKMVAVVDTVGSAAKQVAITNLWADLTEANFVSVNQMRQAFAIQRLLEKDARGGTRYREMLKAHFGVSIPDSTVQVPEYLAGKRIPLNMMQVLQTSENGSTPLGTTGAFSNTFDKDHSFVKSFTEYGYIIGVACIRTSQSYSYGIPKHFLRERRYEWYHPVFANLGEQAIYKKELFINPSATADTRDDVFGYNEAWAEYRYKPNNVAGYLAPKAGDSILSSWTYTNRFTAQPVLNADFIKQPKSQIDNTLVVSNSNYQFICDFYFDLKCTRPMPLYSIPGLIDHH